ncbi:TPA: hypothetical protein QDB40_003549 [Burkholderia vietnamiensis]|uniref:hypothetical protein n=1 Tax=Burkholderia cepacia TaxID=292 RepID=UPI002653B12D|nr:hypothetical protein [Burkholderia cepacia]MDN7857958.1 hypothetical protein [Burkholderia cepacia]HDR9169552.1 hypothetical protein [Burkholderia vietnamiensis]
MSIDHATNHTITMLAALTINNCTIQADRDPFKRMTPEARAAIVAAVEQVFDQAKATIAAFILQPDDDEEPGSVIVDTDRDFRDCYGYPASWDHEEVSQPRQRPTPGAMAEAMLRDTARSSDEMDEGLFEGIDHD